MAEQLASMIDHTLLRPAATAAEIRTVCAEAVQHGFASVCVNSSWVALVKKELAGSSVKTCTTIGFALGAASTAAKAAETRQAIADGADEVDMVINVGRLKDGDRAFVLADIKAVVEAAQGRTVKVIIETALLTDEEKVAACRIAQEAGAHFVKTSTGFNGGGATAEDIALMRRTVGQRMGVKASGGIRDRAAAEKMIAAGANRIGCSAGVAIVSGGQTDTLY